MNDQDFDWTHLSKSLDVVENLQQLLYEKMYDASQSTDQEVTLDYWHTYYALMEKQHILDTRLTLMRMEELDGIKDAIDQYCTALGKHSMETTLDFHIRMKEEIKDKIYGLTGEHPDNFDGIDIELL